MSRIYCLSSLGLCALLLCTPTVQAQTAQPKDPQACAGISNDSQRLACYDHAVDRPKAHGDAAKIAQEDSAQSPEASSISETSSAKPKSSLHGTLFGRERSVLISHNRKASDKKSQVSLLDSRWELEPDSKLGTFTIRGYKPVYLLPAFYTTHVNDRPTSPAPDHTVNQPMVLDHTEAKFQLSLKTKAWQGVFGDYGDLWLGYTQTSHWQLYNSKISRPFRETNYEPEAMLVFSTDYHVFGWRGHLLGIGINHQSNGRRNPLSRSWNRVIARVGFERGPWTVMIRPWWRIHEQPSKDDNPDIEDYMGRGDIQIVREVGGNEFTLMARHSLRSGDRSHGALRFTWAFPIHDKLRGYVQIFHGYGESLIDYNHKATYVGLGVSLLGWY